MIPFIWIVQNKQIHSDGEQTAGGGGRLLLSGYRVSFGVMKYSEPDGGGGYTA